MDDAAAADAPTTAIAISSNSQSFMELFAMRCPDDCLLAAVMVVVRIMMTTMSRGAKEEKMGREQKNHIEITF